MNSGRVCSSSTSHAVGKLHFVFHSLWHYRRANTGLLLGTILAAAILSGALSVGDSVKHTLRTDALLRLGNVEFAAVPGERMFSTVLADDLATKLDVNVCAVLTLPGMAIHQNAADGARKQLNRVQILGVDDRFWSFGAGSPGSLERREIMLDTRTAKTLGVKPGDAMALRIAMPSPLSRDVPLSSREEDNSKRANFTVKAIVADEQMGRFSLQPTQIPPFNCFVRLSDLQQLANTPEQGNLLLAARGPDIANAQEGLDSVWRPQYSGLEVLPATKDLLLLQSDRIFLDEATEKAALAIPSAEGTLTYLVNTLQSEGRMTPYGFVTAGGSLTADLADDEMVANTWLAEHLALREGSKVRVAYYVVLPSNQFEERTRDFTVKRILPMGDFASERALVPEFPGLSNVESCKDWKIGMPMDEELLRDQANETYWNEYRQTPKALVSLSAGQAMWGSRFGRLTAVRYDARTVTADTVVDGLRTHLNPEDVGLSLMPVREDAVRAVEQSTDLGGLFLGMSLFLLISAFVLTAMLYAFGVQQRSQELGALSALGFPVKTVFLLLFSEAMAVAAVGAVAGSVTGLGYAWLLMAALERVWPDVVGRIAILFHATPKSLVIAVAGTLVMAAVAAALTLRRLLRHHVAELLAGDFSQATEPASRRQGRAIGAGVAAILAISLALNGLFAQSTHVAGLFFGSGALLLLAGILLTRHFLARSATFTKASVPTVFSLALANAARRRGRSLAIVASLSAGGFMVLAVSSMQADYRGVAAQRSSGTGGFTLYAESTVPILDPSEVTKAVPGIEVWPLRIYESAEASCLNLNHALTPRVVGIDVNAMAKLHAFSKSPDNTPWDALFTAGDREVPALVGDADTAMWTLRKRTGPSGDTLMYKAENGNDTPVKLVGHLPMRLSIFQGSILMSAEDFTRLWPSREGFRAFLIQTRSQQEEEVIQRLITAFERQGLDVSTTVARLEMFHVVESTYLRMFLVLGGIGLLLGASATAVVALRNLIERRREIALLRAVGFPGRAVFQLVATEYGVLLFIGVAIGAVASAVAMVPALTAPEAGASPLWRLTVLMLVLGSALACMTVAIRVGLRRTTLEALRSE